MVLGQDTRTDIAKNFYTLFTMSRDTGHGIGEVVERTGVAEATLRMWERRYGFPNPERLASGHRRYSAGDIELIRSVAARRSAGLSLAAAIEQTRSHSAQPAMSVFAGLRHRRPDLEPRTLRKPLMLALTRAIEDEALARAERLIVFGSFQHERFYRESEARWRELARTAEVASVFADFGAAGRRTATAAEGAGRRDGPTKISVPPEHPLNREWALACEGEDFAVCLTGWETPDRADGPDRGRQFEAIWSVEPDVVREGVRICAAAAEASGSPLASTVRSRLESPTTLDSRSQLRLASAVTARTLGYLSAWR